MAQWTAPAMRLDFRNCLQTLGADMAVCEAEWDTRVGVYHWRGKSDDEATISAFGDLYDIHCAPRRTSPIKTTSSHQASPAAGTMAQAAQTAAQSTSQAKS